MMGCHATGEHRTQLLVDQDDEREATWRERALNAEDALKAAHAEIISQRIRIGELLGQVRDLEAERTEEAIARITTENTTLQAASPPAHHRQPHTRRTTPSRPIQPAFQDRRIADARSQIADPHAIQ